MTLIGRAFGALVWLLCGLSSAQADMILSATEVEQTLRHGPWPPEVISDPSNRVSGDAEAISFGEALFSDPILSSDHTISCASCHDPAQDFSDGLRRAEGRRVLDRNTQALWNLSGQRWFGWAGASDSLWAHSVRPILNPAELGHDASSLQSALYESEHRPAYEALFGEMGEEPAIETTVNVAKVLAAYIETLRSGKTSFDDFRDALAIGDIERAAQYPEQAQRGLQIFIGRGNCTFCHSGPAFTNGEFHDAAVPYFLEQGGVDPGRAEGITQLLESPFTLDGDFTDDPIKARAWAVRNVRFQHRNFGIFRVPTLRRSAHTAPYMHDGSLPNLSAVVQHYNHINMERLHSDGEAILRPLGLSDREAEDLEAFLKSLSDD